MSKQVLQTNIATLTGKLAIGSIPLDIGSLRLIGGNVIGNLTEGLLLDGNTAPSLQRVNQDTDKALRVIWAAGSAVEVQFPPVALPRDLDDTADMVVHLLMGKDAAANSFTVDVQAFFGVGDTECGAATQAVALAAVTDYTATIAAADVLPYPNVLNISLTPAAHAGDALWLYGAWIEYTKVA